MPIDRTATLRKAEKLLRQGKLEPAIAEYLRVLEDQPQDWNTANALGDLYVRAGYLDRAVEQFVRIADHLSEEGFLPKAGALYKKILKLKPGHEHALLQSAEIAAEQGLFAAARAHLNTVIERRHARGDRRGAGQARVRLGSLDPADFEARFLAAGTRVELGDVAGAVRDLKEIAAELAEKGRQADAVEALRQAALLNPSDEEIREQLLNVYVAAGDFVRARQCAATALQFRALAAALDAGGHADEALETLREAARLDPADADLKAHLARSFVVRGDLKTAAQYLTTETAGSDPQLLIAAADIQLRGDKVDEGLALVHRLLDEDPSRREQIALVGWTLARQQPEIGFRVVELAAETAVAHADWPGAAAALQEFVTRVPNHVPALLRLVEICVDGGLEATMYSAQVQLTDAYIAAGMATEARFVAEDLVAREPWERANIERFRRALVLLGEPDPDALIAERLSGESPFTSLDRSPNSIEDPPLQPAVRAAEAAPAATAHTRSKSAEVGLSVVLDDIKRPQGATQRNAQGSARGIDGVFEDLRDEASRRFALDAAEEDYRRGLVLREAGDIDGCIEALQNASRTPKLRFATASLLGRLFRERGLLPQAIEWFERAAQAPAPTPDQAHELLYDLADVLEKVGEVARALAVSLELQVEARGYRDIDARIDRLMKAQARG